MNLEKFLIWTIKFGLFGCLFIPLIVTKSTFFPFVFGKAIVFQVLVEVCFILWIVWRIWFADYDSSQSACFGSANLPHRGKFAQGAGFALRQGRNHGCSTSPLSQNRPLAASKNKEFSDKKIDSGRLLNYSLIFFFLILFITTLFSLDQMRSFWSTQERMTGFFNWLHFGMFYIMLISVFKKKDFIWFLRVSLLVSVIVSIVTLGFYQIPTRLSGPLGNPGFLAMYLLFHVFFGMWMLLQNQNTNFLSCGTRLPAENPQESARSPKPAETSGKLNFGSRACLKQSSDKKFDSGSRMWISWSWRIFYIAAIILNLIVFYFARTRGAYLGLGIGILLFVFINAIYYVKKRSRTWRDWKRWVALGILIIFLCTAGFFAYKQKEAFQRGSKARTISWGISWNAFKERPLLGWGPENYILAFAKHFDPEHAEYGKDWFDKAHNNVFEYLVTIGVFGFLAYVMIFIFASIKSPKFIMPLLLAYFIANLFWMETTVSLMLLFLVLAMAQRRVWT